jgi:hypothetical protein
MTRGNTMGLADIACVPGTEFGFKAVVWILDIEWTLCPILALRDTEDGLGNQCSLSLLIPLSEIHL